MKTPNNKPILTHHRELLTHFENQIETYGTNIDRLRVMLETGTPSRGFVASANYSIAHEQARMDACAVCRDALILSIERLIDPGKPR